MQLLPVRLFLMFHIFVYLEKTNKKNKAGLKEGNEAKQEGRQRFLRPGFFWVGVPAQTRLFLNG